jgi:ubiquinone biosynthesis accessory factor UbiJ
MPLTNLLCGLLETGVNQLHQLDSSAVIKRKQLNGIIIAASLKELNIPLYFAISNQQIDVLNKFEGQPDCSIRVSLSALNKLQNNHQLTHLIKSGQLEVEGDIQLVQQFAKLLTDMQIDWEEHLSHKVGDVIAHKLCYGAKKWQQGALSQLNKIEKQTALYVTEEIKMAPNGLEVAYFCEQVKTLDMQTEKLNKLMEKLNKQFIAQTLTGQ